jgi:hypothetical protein
MLCGSVTGGIPGSTSMVAAGSAGGGATVAAAEGGGAALDGAMVDGAMLDRDESAGIDMPAIDSCGSTGRVSAVTVADVVAPFGAPLSVLEHAARTSMPTSKAVQLSRWRLIELPFRRGMTATPK